MSSDTAAGELNLELDPENSTTSYVRVSREEYQMMLEALNYVQEHSRGEVGGATTSYSLTTAEISILSTKASEAKATAYCPYSHFRVGATILTQSGEYISGANVENASYPVGTCAERVAFGKAVTSMPGGFKKGMFKALAVSTDIAPPASPCGMCRQFIREFCDLDMPIYMFDKDEKHVVKTLRDLLPMSFGPDDLLSPKDMLTRNV